MSKTITTRARANTSKLSFCLDLFRAVAGIQLQMLNSDLAVLWADSTEITLVTGAIVAEDFVASAGNSGNVLIFSLSQKTIASSAVFNQLVMYNMHIH